MNSMKCELLPAWLVVAVMVSCLVSTAALAATPREAGAELPEGDGDATQVGDDDGVDTPLVDPGRRPLEDWELGELEELGFEFESTLTQRERAHATVFAMTAGAVVPGAGHWQLDDSRTGLALVATEVIAVTMLAGGTFLSLRPTGTPRIDDRRRELFFLGTGLLGARRLVDIVGTAYRDELGIPDSTRRRSGWGMTAGYEYLRPPELSMRHLYTVSAAFRSRHLQLDVGTAQELGWGMSDYRARGRWFPLVGTNPVDRLGFGLTGRFLHYRLDEPFQRADVMLTLETSFDLGGLFAHLDQMEGGLSVGYGLEGRRRQDDDEEWTSMSRAQSLIPMRMYLAFNAADPLRLEVGLQRGMRHWLEPVPSRVGVPTIDVTYRSADRLDLLFSSIFGTGSGVGAGLRLWFGE